MTIRRLLTGPQRTAELFGNVQGGLSPIFRCIAAMTAGVFLMSACSVLSEFHVSVTNDSQVPFRLNLCVDGAQDVLPGQTFGFDLPTGGHIGCGVVTEAGAYVGCLTVSDSDANKNYALLADVDETTQSVTCQKET